MEVYIVTIATVVLNISFWVWWIIDPTSIDDVNDIDDSIRSVMSVDSNQQHEG